MPLISFDTPWKTKYNTKRKKLFPIKPAGYVAKVVQQFHSDMKNARNNDAQFEKVRKVAPRSYDDLEF